MRSGQATGLQIAFLMFAVMLLAVPLSNYIVKSLSLTGASSAVIEKGMHFALAVLVICAFPSLRRFARQALAMPIPGAMRTEVALVTLAKLAHAFATAAAIAIWLWLFNGPESVETMVVNVDREVANAFSEQGLVRLVLASTLGPFVEELVFRGFVYRAFERQWGWLASTVATSALFGIYHAHFWSSFASSIIFICVLRRTGSIWAPIIVHAVFNLMLWWPLLGQHVFPHGVVLSDPATWYFHFACLAFVIVALPIYVWMARDRHVVAPTVFLDPHAALSK